MAQGGVASQPKRWQAWVLAIGAVFYALGAAYSLVTGDYWTSLLVGCAAVNIGLVSTGVTRRGGAWNVLILALFGVGLLAFIASFVW